VLRVLNQLGGSRGEGERLKRRWGRGGRNNADSDGN